MQHFRFSFIFTFICLVIAGWWGYSHSGGSFSAVLTALALTAILAVMEVSLSFDNAVVNATVLKGWNPFWQLLFLTVGMLIAVFGMRLVFPIAIVAVTADMGFIEVIQLALNDPKQYAAKLTAHHAEIAAFGGMFLLMVFLNFMFDDKKQTHWFRWLEHRLAQLAKVDAMAAFVALLTLLVALSWVDEVHKSVVLLAGVWGIVVYLGVGVLSSLLEGESDDNNTGDAIANKAIMRGGVAGFVYLEVLDASFSFDGVIGAFAITNDVVIIMLGLAIGAMFVRSLTIYLVEKNTLESYVYLEHGAHYAISALAIIMLLSMKYHIPELITGVIGVTFIVWATLSSIKVKKK